MPSGTPRYTDERASAVVGACAALLLAHQIASDPDHARPKRDPLNKFAVLWSVSRKQRGTPDSDAVAQLGTAIINANVAAIDGLVPAVDAMGAALRGMVKYPVEEHARTRRLLARCRDAAARGVPPPPGTSVQKRVVRLMTLAEALEVRGAHKKARRESPKSLATVVAHIGNKAVRVVAKGRGGRDDHCEIRGPSQIQMFKAVALATSRRSEGKDGTWERIEEEFAKARNWKGRLVKRPTLRDYGLRIERKLKDANLGADWSRASDGGWTWTGGVELDS